MIRLRVKEIMQEKRMSQGKLQRRSDMDMKSIRKVLRNPFTVVTTETLDKLAMALECDPRELIEPWVEGQENTPSS